MTKKQQSVLDVIRQRQEALFEEDFMPAQSAEQRIPKAVEQIAYELQDIKRIMRRMSLRG